MKRIIVTGATGFVGANLTRRLVRDGHDVHLLVRQECNPWRIEDIYPDVHIHKTDLSNKEHLTNVVGQIKPEWIFHIAVYGAYSWQTDFHQMIQTNIAGTVNLVEASLKTGFESFVNTGTSSEYGYKDHTPKETEYLEPNSYYAFTKASSTMFCRYIGQSKKIHIPTLRLYSVYGPFEEPNRLIPTLAIRGLEGKLPPLVKPDIGHDFVFIEDVINAYLLAASNSVIELGAVYNVGTGIQTSIRDIVASVRGIMKIHANPEWGSMPNREWDTKVWIADNHKIKTELGWYPEYTFDQGFSQMIKWLKSDSALLNIYNHKVTKHTLFN